MNYKNFSSVSLALNENLSTSYLKVQLKKYYDPYKIHEINSHNGLYKYIDVTQISYTDLCTFYIDFMINWEMPPPDLEALHNQYLVFDAPRKELLYFFIRNCLVNHYAELILVSDSSDI